jgi:hypothetical protein
MPLAKLLDADQSQIGFPPKTIEDGLIANRQFFSLKNIEIQSLQKPSPCS